MSDHTFHNHNKSLAINIMRSKSKLSVHCLHFNPPLYRCSFTLTLKRKSFSRIYSIFTYALFVLDILAPFLIFTIPTYSFQYLTSPFILYSILLNCTLSLRSCSNFLKRAKYALFLFYVAEKLITQIALLIERVRKMFRAFWCVVSLESVGKKGVTLLCSSCFSRFIIQKRPNEIF